MIPPRPDQLVLVVGTGTEVGKTWVGAAVLAHLRAEGRRVAARKPAQSFEPGDATTDAQELGRATGESATTVCPPHRWYPVALAPPMAADVLSRPPFTLAELGHEIEWPDHIELGLVETAGGVRSPQAGDDGDAVDLARWLAPDVVVLVADAGLGTLNAVRLSVAALAPALDAHRGTRLVVVLNRFDPGDDLHRRNRAWLADHDGIDAVTGIGELVARLSD